MLTTVISLNAYDEAARLLIQIKTRTLKLMMLTDVGAVHGQSLLIK